MTDLIAHSPNCPASSAPTSASPTRSRSRRSDRHLRRRHRTTTSGSTPTPSAPRTARSARPIAHGFLTLSLVIPFWTELFDVEGVSTKVNYGLDRVRFTSPVPVGSRVRMHQ